MNNRIFLQQYTLHPEQTRKHRNLSQREGILYSYYTPIAFWSPRFDPQRHFVFLDPQFTKTTNRHLQLLRANTNASYTTINSPHSLYELMRRPEALLSILHNQQELLREQWHYFDSTKGRKAPRQFLNITHALLRAMCVYDLALMRADLPPQELPDLSLYLSTFQTLSKELSK